MSDPRFPGDRPSGTPAPGTPDGPERPAIENARDDLTPEASRAEGPPPSALAIEDASSLSGWDDLAPAPVAVQVAPQAAPAASPKRATPTGMRAANRVRPGIAVRIFATLALAAAVTTYVAVEVDLVRRHFPGVDPLRYWLPQLQQVTLPGLGATAIAALLALGIYKLQRRRT
ncbi:MAG TPA: hypothetical protein VGG33_20710 [Polyangia bacterium]